MGKTPQHACWRCRAAYILVCLALWSGSALAQGPQHEFTGTAGAFVAERMVSGLSPPRAIEFLPDGEALVSQQTAGVLSRFNFASGQRVDITGMPPVLVHDGAGLFDLELHPQYADNGWVYVSYAEGDEQRNTLVLDRIRIDGSQVAARERIFTADAWSEISQHYGARIQFSQGYVYLSIGDRQHPDQSQDLSNHVGTIVRLHDDGRVPEDNPFVGSDEQRQPARPEIWSYGHRNPQGLFVHPQTGELWSHEHGPRGGDELNLVVRGGNYGWPVISYGFEYSGGPIGMGIVRQEGMEQPVWVYVPSIAPSDLMVYQGEAFPGWQGSFLLGSLAYVHLNRLQLADGQVVLEERLASGLLGRIRCIDTDALGRIYLGSDSGEIWRLRPR